MSMYFEKTHQKKAQTASTVQRKSDQKSSGFQFVDNRPQTVAQRKLLSMMDQHSANKQSPIQKKKAPEQKQNNTGLPDNLKSGIEQLSGHSMDDVKVHYNSDKPAQLNAHAYAQGTDIHLASGQEKHLPHEAWHVVQQKQGRVQPTLQMKNKVSINDDKCLECEADEMGEKAMKLKPLQKKVLFLIK